MSLDIYLISETPVSKTGTGIFVRESGSTRELTPQEARQRYPDFTPIEIITCEVFRANITSNLANMARHCLLYHPLWHPEQVGVYKAADLVPFLKDGLDVLLDDPEGFKQFNPANGWGTYEDLVNLVKDYLAACQLYPDATIEVSS